MPGSTIIELPNFKQAEMLFELRRARYGYLLLSATGYTPTQIGAVLFCSRSSVYRVVKAYRAGSFDELAEFGRQGQYARLLTPSLRRSLLSLLNKAPAAFGWCRVCWSCATLAIDMKSSAVKLSCFKCGKVSRKTIKFPHLCVITKKKIARPKIKPTVKHKENTRTCLFPLISATTLAMPTMKKVST